MIDPNGTSSSSTIIVPSKGNGTDVSDLADLYEMFVQRVVVLFL